MLTNQQRRLLAPLGFQMTLSGFSGVKATPNGLDIVVGATPKGVWTIGIYCGFKFKDAIQTDSDSDLPRYIEKMESRAAKMWGPNDDATGNFD